MRILLLILVLVSCGCRKDDAGKAAENVDGDVSGETTTITTGDGAIVTTDGKTTEIKTREGSVVVGAQTAPQGFPLPVMANAIVHHSWHGMSEKEEVYQLNYRVAGELSDIAKFHEDAMKAKGLKVQRNDMQHDRSTHITLMGKSESAEVTALISRDRPEDTPSVVISWTSKAKK